MTMSRRRFIKACTSIMVAASSFEFFFPSPTSSGAGNRQIPVLAYHRVGYTSDALTVSPKRFANDLEALKEKGYHSISLEDFQRFINDRNVELPEKPVVITFDDGYLDNFENAYPLLQKYGMTGAFFIITGMMGKKERLASDHLVEMAQGGMSFGSHTVTHNALAELDQGAVYTEVVNSKIVLEDLLDKKVDAIAYPRGSYNESVIAIAQNVGYRTGFTVQEGLCMKSSPDLELRRIPIFKYDSGVCNVISKRGHLT